MQPKLIKTSLGTYTPAEWTGTNDSGWHVVGDRILVLPDQAAEQSGGIHLPQDVVARMTMSAEGGLVVSVGDGAFKWNSDKVTPFEGRKPEPGDRVCIEKFSGQLLHGKDGKVYRLMESACIGALYDKKEIK